MSAILITGISGGLSQLVAERLLAQGREVVGVDYRRYEPVVQLELPVYRASYNKTKIEDVFRHHKIDTVLHLGRVGNLKEDSRKRFDLNVIGSQKLMDLSLKYGVKRLLILSTFHIYGAHASNHIPIFEDEPLRAGQNFPQIADALQLDNQSLTWVYRHREVRTVMLRPTNVVGPHLRNAMSRFLRLRTVPYLAGFNPMLQFIHECDLRDAILAAYSGDATGVYNVAGSGAMPFRTALDIIGVNQIPVTESMVGLYLKATSLLWPQFPRYLVDFFKYPCIISDERLRKELDWEPKVGMIDTVRDAVVPAPRLAERNQTAPATG